jgi:cytochrome P450
MCSLLPTKRNRLIAECKSKLNTLLLEIIQDGRRAVEQGKMDSYGNDLLGRMIAAASEGTNENTNEFNLASVFNNCKNFYFAGQETVANVTSFTVLMLARHQEWQDRARKEVLELVADEENFDPSVLSHLKVVSFFCFPLM